MSHPRKMLQTNRTKSLPAKWLPLVTGAIALLVSTAGFAQSSSSSSSQNSTTAAPGTAAIQAPRVAAQITAQRTATYTEKFEVFGGLNLMNGEAGQNLPKRYNMGGAEVMATYWLGGNGMFRRFGIAADYRFEGGTTPILPVGTQFGLNRVAVFQNIISGGAQYRVAKNRYAAVDLHALAGGTHGTFNSAIANYPQNVTPQPTAAYVGLYPNETSPWGAAGGSIEFNQSPRLAVRLSPDIIFEHFGTETREFVAVSGGVVYRFGKRK